MSSNYRAQRRRQKSGEGFWDEKNVAAQEGTAQRKRREKDRTERDRREVEIQKFVPVDEVIVYDKLVASMQDVAVSTDVEDATIRIQRAYRASQKYKAAVLVNN